MNDLTAPSEPAELQLRLLTATQLQYRRSPNAPWSAISGPITFDPQGARSARLTVQVEPDVSSGDLSLTHDGSSVRGTTTARAFTGPTVDVDALEGGYELTLSASTRTSIPFRVVVSNLSGGIDFTDSDPTPPPPPPTPTPAE